MPKIYIKGEPQPTIVSQEVAERALQQKNDPKYKEMIDINKRRVAKTSIKEISFEDSQGPKTYNLSVQSDREEIKVFEKMLEDLKEKASLINPIEYYGSPLTTEKFKGCVLNDLLGGVHWTTVAYAIREKMIERKIVCERVYWSIVNDSIEEDHPNIERFKEFEKKLKALAELRSKRVYAEKKSFEGHQKVVQESRREFIKTHTYDNLPF
jgi:hypothetical protein